MASFSSRVQHAVVNESNAAKSLQSLITELFPKVTEAVHDVNGDALAIFLVHANIVPHLQCAKKHAWSSIHIFADEDTPHHVQDATASSLFPHSEDVRVFSSMNQQNMWKAMLTYPSIAMFFDNEDENDVAILVHAAIQWRHMQGLATNVITPDNAVLNDVKTKEDYRETASNIQIEQYIEAGEDVISPPPWVTIWVYVIICIMIGSAIAVTLNMRKQSRKPLITCKSGISRG